MLYMHVEPREAWKRDATWMMVTHEEDEQLTNDASWRLPGVLREQMLNNPRGGGLHYKIQARENTGALLWPAETKERHLWLVSAASSLE